MHTRCNRQKKQVPSPKTKNKRGWKSLETEIRTCQDIPLPRTFNRLISWEVKRQELSKSVLSNLFYPSLAREIVAYFTPIPPKIRCPSKLWPTSGAHQSDRDQMKFIFGLVSCWNSWKYLYNVNMEDILPY